MLKPSLNPNSKSGQICSALSLHLSQIPLFNCYYHYLSSPSFKIIALIYDGHNRPLCLQSFLLKIVFHHLSFLIKKQISSSQLLD